VNILIRALALGHDVNQALHNLTATNGVGIGGGIGGGDIGGGIGGGIGEEAMR
jgi:hypothetical protein